uniref:FERM domain-containing protein n=1 Tax=Panagrolaimus sp. JU765 TaxID=591449 RepID=A0AC34Q0T6_9BILA
MKIFWGKKSGRYELSQDIFVLNVKIVDYCIAQCTLDSNSTSRDCLDYLRQKLNIKQIEIFGLKYQTKFNDSNNLIWKWIEPEKSLKKQLDKYSCQNRNVQLEILFYTPNIFALYDFSTRSLYYTLLKIDVLEGKFNFEIEDYVNLAALSLQIEYGDYEPTIHTLDLLRSLPLFPQQLCRSIQFFDDFLLRILTKYESHSGKDSSTAAIEYIYEISQNENYGEILFDAKDDESTEVKIGYRLDFIIVKRLHASTLFFNFFEIKEIVPQKRNLILKCKDGTNSTFLMANNEISNYLCMIFNWQMKFSTNDAIIHKSVPKNLKNLQIGQNPTIMPLTKITSIDITNSKTYDSIDLGTNGSICSQCPPCSSSSILTRTTSNPFMTSSIHGSQLVNKGRLSISEVSKKFTTVLPPSTSTPSIPQQFIVSSGLPSSIILPFDARDVEHKILRQLLSEKRAARKMGSSPEIHTITNSRYTSNSVVNKAPLGGVGKRLNGKFQANETFATSLSTPDLHYRSTPNLTQTNQYSKGRVISSTARPTGQAITYPIPQPIIIHSNLISKPSNHLSMTRLPLQSSPPLENLQTILSQLKPPSESPNSSSQPSFDEVS